MKSILALSTIVACSVSGFALASDCFAPALDSIQMRQCASEAFAAADAELNDLWPQVVAHFKEVDADVASYPHSSGLMPERKAADLIVEAQRAWIILRDNDALAAAAPVTDRSFASLSLLSIKTERTQERIATLKRYLNDEFLGNITGPAAARWAELTEDSEECKLASSNVAWKFCVGAVSEKADLELNDFYRIAKSALAQYPGATSKLTQAQRAWIKLRDADCAAATRISWGGSGQSGFEATCIGLTSIERTVQIRGSFPHK